MWGLEAGRVGAAEVPAAREAQLSFHTRNADRVDPATEESPICRGLLEADGWSRTRDLEAWEADALPTELRPQCGRFYEPPVGHVPRDSFTRRRAVLSAYEARLAWLDRD